MSYFAPFRLFYGERPLSTSELPLIKNGILVFK
jgi:hypothetical protein